MSCILCFLTDSYQSALRQEAQDKAERFENVLNEYKTLLQQSLEALEPAAYCPHHSDYTRNFLNWSELLRETVQTHPSVYLLFNEVRLAYLDHEKGAQVRAAKQLFSLLEELNIAHAEPQLSTTFFFRGRQSKSRLVLEDIYHLPFNLRDKISPGRFSIAGQPLLHLSASILGVLSELDINLDKLDNTWIGPYTLKNHRSLKIYDISNKLPNICKSVLEKIRNGEKDYIGSTKNRRDTERLGREYLRLLLGSICSFEPKAEEPNTGGRKARACTSEFVIPQLLAEVLRAKKYSGILYTSPKLNNNLYTSHEHFPSTRHKKNIVIFTSHQEESDYDTVTLDKFIIFPPTSINDAFELQTKDLLEVRQHIIDYIDSGKVSGEDLGIDRIPALDFLPHYKKIMIKEKDAEVNYLDHSIGKLHLFQLFQTMTHLRHILQTKMGTKDE